MSNTSTDNPYGVIYPCTGKPPFTEVPDDAKPRIVVNQMDEAEMRDRTIAALQQANGFSEIPVVYQRGGAMYCAAWDENCNPSLRPITRGLLSDFVTRAARYVARSRRPNNDGRFVETKASPPAAVLSAIMDAAEYPFPELRHLAMVPGVRPDGSVHDEKGYDHASGRLFFPNCSSGEFRKVPEAPTDSDVAEALNVLDLLLGDFPWVERADRTNAYAMLMTPLIRGMFKGVCPLFVVTAFAAGSGKTILASLAQNIYGLDSARTLDIPENVEEFKKTVQTAVKAGWAIILLDNLDFPLQSGAMCSMITAQDIAFRIMGGHTEFSVPNESMFQITGNNVQVRGDMQRRVVEIRLDAKRHDPGNRDASEFKVELPSWAVRERSQIVWSLLVLVRRWVVDGMPDAPSGVPVSAAENFGDWARVVGGVLENVGVLGFCENRRETLMKDPDPFEWAAFLTAIRNAVGEYEFTTAELVEKITTSGLNGSDLVKVVPRSLGNPFDTGFPKRLGNQFSTKAGMRFPECEFMLVNPRTARGRAKWQVTPCD